MFPLLLLAGAGILYWVTTMRAAPVGEAERAEQIQLLMAEQDRMMGLDTGVYGDIGAAQTQDLLVQLDVERAEFWEATGETGTGFDYYPPVDDFFGEAAGEI